MAKSRAQKESLLEQYKGLLNDNGGYVAVDFKGIDNYRVTDLKKKLKAIGSNVHIIKNKVFQIALRETEQPASSVDFAEQTAIITYDADPTEVAKLVKEVQKESELLEARHGVVDGKYLDSVSVMRLADIPSREELLAKMLGSMSAPLTGFARVLKGNVQGFTQVIKQLSEKEG